MVVSEAKIVFGFNDVVRVRFRCHYCGNEIVVRLDSEKRPTITKQCPLCHEEWLSRLGAERIQKILQGIQEMEAPKADILIEIDAPAR